MVGAEAQEPDPDAGGAPGHPTTATATPAEHRACRSLSGIPAYGKPVAPAQSGWVESCVPFAIIPSADGR